MVKLSGKTRLLFEMQDSGILTAVSSDGSGSQLSDQEAMGLWQSARRIRDDRYPGKVDLFPGSQSVIFAVRMDRDLRSRVKTRSHLQNISVSEYVRKALLFYESAMFSVPVPTAELMKKKRWPQEAEDSVIRFLSLFGNMSFKASRLSKELAITPRALRQILTYLLDQGLIHVDHKQALDPESGKRSLNFYKIGKVPAESISQD